MKRCSKYQLLAAISACVILPTANPALADEPVETPDTSNWVCKLCPISGGWFGDWDLGLIYVDDPTPKFADYRGLDDDGAYVEAGGFSRYLNDQGYYFDFYGRDLGLRSRELEMRGGKQGFYQLRASYNEIPRYLGHDTVTPYTGVGTDTLVLPEAWQTQPLAPATLESKRKTIGAGFTVKIASSWKFQADFERQKKKGTQSFGGGVLINSAALFPAPIDYTTKQFNMGLEYTADRGQLRLEFIGSKFNNDNNSVTWDNPIAIGFGDEISRSALAPDNKYHQLSLAGAFRISPRFRLSGKAAFGKIKQNDAFLPYTINPTYSDLALPRDSLDGKVDTSMFNLSGRAYVRLADRLDLTAQYKSNKRDNKTPVDFYTPVLEELFPSDPRSNRPYGYDRKLGKIELRYRPTYKLRLNAGFMRTKQERTYQEVRKTDENTFWGEVQFTAWAWLDTRLKYDYQDRDGTESIQQGNYDRAENPLMRKFNMADRKRNRATIEFDLSPIDRLGINLSYYTTQDDYKASVIGLTESEVRSLNLDINYALNKHTNFYGFITGDRIESEMSGADVVDATPWNAFTKDKILTWGLGVSGQINDKITYGLDYVASDSNGDILTDSGTGEAPFPVLKTNLKNLRVYMQYQFNKRWGLGLDAYREDYDTSDWTVDGVGPFDINGVLTMGDTSPDYSVNVVRLMATLNF